MSDVLIGKQQSLERCLLRVRQAWAQPSTLPFEEDYDKQDIIVLNHLDDLSDFARVMVAGMHDEIDPETFE